MDVCEQIAHRSQFADNDRHTSSEKPSLLEHEGCDLQVAGTLIERKNDLQKGRTFRNIQTERVKTTKTQIVGEDVGPVSKTANNCKQHKMIRPIEKLYKCQHCFLTNNTILCMKKLTPVGTCTSVNTVAKLFLLKEAVCYMK